VWGATGVRVSALGLAHRTVRWTPRLPRARSIPRPRIKTGRRRGGICRAGIFSPAEKVAFFPRRSTRRRVAHSGGRGEGVGGGRSAGRCMPLFGVGCAGRTCQRGSPVTHDRQRRDLCSGGALTSRVDLRRVADKDMGGSGQWASGWAAIGRCAAADLAATITGTTRAGSL